MIRKQERQEEGAGIRKQERQEEEGAGIRMRVSAGEGPVGQVRTVGEGGWTSPNARLMNSQHLPNNLALQPVLSTISFLNHNRFGYELMSDTI